MKIISLIFCLFLLGCNSNKIPDTKLSQFKFEKPEFQLNKNTLTFNIKNPIHCPLRVWIKTENKSLKEKLDRVNPIEVIAKSDTIISINGINNSKEDLKFGYSIRLGSTNKQTKNIDLDLPFPKGKSYKIIQGNNGKHSHNSNYSKYAIDFNLKVNDTICSANSGYVVGVIEDYKHGGKDKKWRPYSNFITIYHPESGLFTQYVHLTYKGSLVKIGDVVKSGQAIGLSEKTGYTNIEHLHFNCLIPTNNNDGLKSTSYNFKEGYHSENLKKNDIIKNTFTQQP